MLCRNGRMYVHRHNHPLTMPIQNTQAATHTIPCRAPSTVNCRAPHATPAVHTHKHPLMQPAHTQLTCWSVTILPQHMRHMTSVDRALLLGYSKTWQAQRKSCLPSQVLPEKLLPKPQTAFQYKYRSTPGILKLLACNKAQACAPTHLNTKPTAPQARSDAGL